MKILLTGGAGFVGQVTAQTLADLGHKIVTTDRQGNVDMHGDLSDGKFTRMLPVVDWVVHTAGVQYVSTDLPLLKRRHYFERHNVSAMKNICQRFGGTNARFLNVGTSMMYLQGTKSSLHIRSPMVGQGQYSLSKLMAQQFMASHIRHWATVIPCIIGGPGRGGLFSGFVKSILRRGSVIIPGDGKHPIHMVHVNDVASLIGSIISDDARGFFNAAAPLPLSITQWVDVIADELNITKTRIHCLPLGPVALLAQLSGYRLLAHEQILMLTYPHVLDTYESNALGWIPAHDNSRIVRDTAKAIVARLLN